MKTLLQGGTVVSGNGPKRADILVEDEKILRVGRGLPAAGAQVAESSEVEMKNVFPHLSLGFTV